MKPATLLLLSLLVLAGCGRRDETADADKAQSLPEARRGFQSRLTGPAGNREPAPSPPPDVFRTVKYGSPVGELTAYLSPDPGDDNA